MCGSASAGGARCGTALPTSSRPAIAQLSGDHVDRSRPRASCALCLLASRSSVASPTDSPAVLGQASWHDPRHLHEVPAGGAGRTCTHRASATSCRTPEPGRSGERRHLHLSVGVDAGAGWGVLRGQGALSTGGAAAQLDLLRRHGVSQLLTRPLTLARLPWSACSRQLRGRCGSPGSWDPVPVRETGEVVPRLQVTTSSFRCPKRSR